MAHGTTELHAWWTGRPMRRSLALSIVVLGSSCLPVDTRAPPATVLVTARGANHLTEGIPATALEDGWAIHFDRYLVTFGELDLQGDPCTPYSDAGYRRVFNALTTVPQKVSVLYALGTCTFAARAGWADADSPLATGVTDDDSTLMHTAGSDGYAGDGAGITAFVAGHATKGDVMKKFSWSFRARSVRYTDCTTAIDEKPWEVTLVGNQSYTMDFQFRGDVLFRDQLDPTKAKLRFAPFAAADDTFGNKDGEITLDELGLMTLADAGVTADETTVGDAGDAGAPDWKTFEDFVYLGLFPHVVGLNDSGECTANVRLKRGPG